MITSDLSFNEFLITLKDLLNKEIVYVDEIPKCLQKDFSEFIIGKTLSVGLDNRTITYDYTKYYNKIINSKGINYPIKFKKNKL